MNCQHSNPSTRLGQSERSLDLTKMDANFEIPASVVPNQNEEKDESSADEDQVLDWSKVACVYEIIK